MDQIKTNIRMNKINSDFGSILMQILVHVSLYESKNTTSVIHSHNSIHPFILLPVTEVSISDLFSCIWIASL